jgi:hypothetical protein
MDIVYKRNYKNARINIIVEDDTITTYEILVDGKVVDKEFVSNEKHPDGFPNNKHYFDIVLEFAKKEVDKQFEELINKIK